MAYIPPHKRRNSQENANPALPPDHAMRSPVSNVSYIGNIAYADHAINTWSAVELGYDGHLPSHVHLEPVSVEAFERRHGRKPLILVNKNRSEDNTAATPWANVAEMVLQNLPSSFEILKNEIDNNGSELMKPTLVARFGNILFHPTWSAVELGYDGHLPSHVHLEPVSVEDFERRYGRKPLILVNKNRSEDNTAGTPWANIAEMVMQNLRSSFEILKNEIDNNGSELMKPTLVARFGNILFHPKSSAETAVDGPLEEAELRRQLRTFSVDITSSYMQNIVDKVVPNIGVEFENEKDIYYVQLFDKTRPDTALSCKCNVTNDKSLILNKVQLKIVRHMLYDFSCLDKDLDLRIMLSRKRTLRGLSDDELNSIRHLISCAVLDSDVRGGLRWPFETSSGDRFEVIGAWHHRAKTYKNQLFRLEVMEADWLDFSLGIREGTKRVDLQLKKVVSQVQEQNATDDTILETLKDNVKMIWDNFLCCEPFLK